MKCCICGCEISNWGNNPYPLCLEEDNNARCCDECNDAYVINARIMATRLVKRKIKENDLVVVFYSSQSSTPIDTMREHNKFLAGYATDNEALPEGQWEGTWGNFLLDEKKDTYMISE